MKYTFYTFLALIIFGSCYQDSENVVETPIVETPNIIVQESHVIGKIMDEYGSLFEDIDLRFNHLSKNGDLPYFYFNSTNIRKLNEVITYLHPSGMELGIPLANIENSINYQYLYLPSSFNTYDYNSNNSISIDLAEDIQLKISNNALLKDGVAYNSTEEILIKYLDQNEEQGQRLIPGHYIMNEFSQRSYLRIDQAFILGFSGVANQNLSLLASGVQLADDETLYYFDPSTGLWSEIDDEFQFISGYYASGKIVPSKILEVKLENEEIIQGLSVDFKLENNRLTRSRFNSNGRAIAHVPQHENIQIDIFNNSSLLQTLNSEPSKTLESIFLNLDAMNVHSITADLRNCEDNKEDAGILLMEVNGQDVLQYIETDMPLNILSETSEEIDFNIYRKNFLQKTTSVTLGLGQDVRLGRQYLCDQILEDYLVFHLEGNYRILTEINYIIVDDLTTITGVDQNTGGMLSLKFERNGDIYILDSKANISLDDTALGDGYKLNCFTSDEGCGFEEFLVSNYGEVDGSFIKGKFKGEFWIESINQGNVGDRFLNGEFQFRR